MNVEQLNWQWESPFTVDIEVLSEHIDELGHVNNAQYVSWMEKCAWEHSRFLKLGLPEYQELDRAMVIGRHEVDYLASCFEGEALRMATWVGPIENKLRMSRYFQLIRLSDGKTLLKAVTHFVCVELSTGRPKKMPESFIQGYGTAQARNYD